MTELVRKFQWAWSTSKFWTLYIVWCSWWALFNLGAIFAGEHGWAIFGFLFQLAWACFGYWQLKFVAKRKAQGYWTLP